MCQWLSLTDEQLQTVIIDGGPVEERGLVPWNVSTLGKFASAPKKPT
jgi:hypothetical protein